MGLVARVALTLLKLLLAFVILAFGCVVFSPSKTSHWPLASVLDPLIARWVGAFAVERSAWGVLIVALGLASLLAALPAKVAGRSKPKAAATSLG